MTPSSLALGVGADSSVPVSELVRRARLELERSFPVLWVSGELSGVTRAASGHLYFSLKDEAAQVRCVMFRNRCQLLPFEPKAGLRVEVRAQVSLYEARGDFQLNIDAMRQAGPGALHEAFLRLKARLDAEGLFDPARKRALPTLPLGVAIVTSLSGAALHDVLSTLSRRARHIEVTVLPCLVQGVDAPAQIAKAIARAGTSGCDVLMVVRGGGSAEDLSAFNDERVARAIAACPVPVVTGVGHETDFSIADFVSDLRAATPTAAAELVSAGHVAAAARLLVLGRRLARATRTRLDTGGQKLDDLSSRLNPPARQLLLARERLHGLHRRMRRAFEVRRSQQAGRIGELTLCLRTARPQPDRKKVVLDHLRERLRTSMYRVLETARHRSGLSSAQLGQLDPAAVLARGYAIVRDRDGYIVRDAANLGIGQSLQLQLGRGRAEVEVRRTCPEAPADTAAEASPDSADRK
ncbi:MAG: exodeoxyribonuclease VII large subunit [Methyloversatilis sp.]|nr:exodeoxyribonuclease VII large subunit [Methyloversatilis sp.]MBP6194756.1 exodeoxyribonuclease VII large subunit [Methyloversatilis sp.]MBP9118340.1 exodeoxyribonuclease VII large subunit [Methyloversatilis sp.]